MLNNKIKTKKESFSCTKGTIRRLSAFCHFITPTQFPLMPDLKTPFRLFLKYSVQVRVGHGQPEKAVSYSCQHGIHKNERWSKSTNTDVFCERNVVTSCRINSHLSGGRSQSDCHVLWRICTCINMFFPVVDMQEIRPSDLVCKS